MEEHNTVKENFKSKHKEKESRDGSAELSVRRFREEEDEGYAKLIKTQRC